MPRTKHTAPEFVLHLDRLPSRNRVLPKIERALNHLADFYGFEEMAPAILEDPRGYAALIKAGFLDEYPPVICKTRNGEEVMLRPSLVLGAIRAYVSHRMQDLTHPVKLCVRGERFFLGPSDDADGHLGARAHTIRVEQEWSLVMIDEESAVAEAEIIQILWKILQELHIGGEREMEVRVNAVGCEQCRNGFRSALGAYFRARKARLCVKSRRDLKKSPAKIFSCPDEKCRIVANLAPQVLDFLCDTCKSHMRSLLEFLDEAHIPYFLDPQFFREGSGFSTMIFECLMSPMAQDRAESETTPSVEILSDVAEVAAPRTGIQDVTPGWRGQRLAEGGRMSAVAALIAGKGVHAASGTLLLGVLERIMQKKESRSSASGEDEMFLVQLGDLAKRKSFALLEALREGGIAVKESLGHDSIKVQLKIAERRESRYALILGQKEALDETVIVREVSSGIQETVPQQKLIEFLKKKLKK